MAEHDRKPSAEVPDDERWLVIDGRRTSPSRHGRSARDALRQLDELDAG